MEPGGPSSFTQQREKLTRLAALAEAVSEQKFPPSSTMRNNNVPMNYELQHYNNAPLQADPMRTESRGFTELNGGHIPATHASPNDINPLSIHELPSNFLHTEQHLLDPVSSLSRKRQRVGYPLNSEEQQMSRKLGPEKERSMQNHQQHHDQNQQSFPPRSNSWPPQPQPQQKPKLQPKKIRGRGPVSRIPGRDLERKIRRAVYISAISQALPRSSSLQPKPRTGTMGKATTVPIQTENRWEKEHPLGGTHPSPQQNRLYLEQPRCCVGRTPPRSVGVQACARGLYRPEQL
mmetsp:Transcript_50934/g.104782  ORF Transcript_50934/g.104782 Transcript_50934/m.104782 type:complete len:291 (-) Transcript_50934:2085-2957(-)